MMDETIAWVIIVCGLMGSLIVLLMRAGAANAFSHALASRAKSADSALIYTWLLGLLIFMAGVGLNAGGGIVEIVQSAGLKLLGAGIVVTLVPVLFGYFFARKILKLNAAEALGGVTGAMTSGAALSVVTDVAKSSAPALGYTGAYAFANVILTLAGTLIMAYNVWMTSRPEPDTEETPAIAAAA